MSRHCITLLSPAIVAVCAILTAAPAAAVDGVVLITHDKAQAGNVTPGDAPGYPVTISQSGSYRLASNLQVRRNRNGIEVDATEVSIDLNGFRIDGAGVANIGILGNQRSLTVRNGTIRKFTAEGIRTVGALLIVEDMRVAENSGIGVHNLTNGVARIVKSTIFGNGASGIGCASSCHVEGNIVTSNGRHGIVFDATGTALGNTIINNVNWGIYANGVVGFGNNTIIGAAPVGGAVIELFPNACSPTAC